MRRRTSTVGALRQDVGVPGQTISYKDSLLAELDEFADDLNRILDASSVRSADLPSNFIGFASHHWEPSDDDLTAARMDALRRLRDWEPRFRLLFPHPTPELAARIDEATDRLHRWLNRDTDDHSIPATIEAAQAKASEAVGALREVARLLPADDWRTRLVVDTNTLIDDADLTRYVGALGRRYLVHVLPVVLGELEDLKRSARTAEVREAARRADRRLKALRDNGDVRVGARVAGDVFAVFEHTEPRAAGLPGWLDLTVPDDRLVSSVLLLQSAHAGSTVYVATSDLNLQTKLTAVGLPRVELPS
jgi:rRNA-processing protein FCF1